MIISRTTAHLTLAPQHSNPDHLGSKSMGIICTSLQNEHSRMRTHQTHLFVLNSLHHHHNHLPKRLSTPALSLQLQHNAFPESTNHKQLCIFTTPPLPTGPKTTSPGAPFPEIPHPLGLTQPPRPRLASPTKLHPPRLVSCSKQRRPPTNACSHRGTRDKS